MVNALYMSFYMPLAHSKLYILLMMETNLGVILLLYHGVPINIEMITPIIIFQGVKE